MTSWAVLGGTAAHPAGSLRQRRLGAGQAPRLSAAIAIVTALHLALLAFRPGVSGASQPTSAAPVMAVRVVPSPRPLAPATDASAAELPTIAPAPAARTATPPAPTVRNAPEEVRPRGDASAGNTAAATAAVPSQADSPLTQRSLAAAPDYALGVTLDPGPRPLDEIEPDYPDVYLREGIVVLRLLISATGHVDDVAVVRSAPEGVFEQAALDAFGKARFAPGLAGGTPVKSQITVEVQFMPINRGARISGRTY